MTYDVHLLYQVFKMVVSYTQLFFGLVVSSHTCYHMASTLNSPNSVGGNLVCDTLIF